MDEIEETTLTRLKNFASRHRGKIIFAATAVAGLALNRTALQQHNEFLGQSRPNCSPDDNFGVPGA